MSQGEKPDGELEELGRMLDRALQAARPRAGFEEELWRRLPASGRAAGRPARAVLGRLRDRGWERIAGAAAVLLLVGLGALLTHHPGPASAPSGAASTPSRPGAQQAEPAVAAGARFGPLPRPALEPELSAAAPRAAQGAFTQATPVPYFGPADVTVAASLALPPAGTVRRYPEPSAADFASRMGARPAAGAGPDLFTGPGFTLTVLGTQPRQGLAPRFVMTLQGPEPQGPPPDPATAQRAADGFLAAHGISPAGAASVRVSGPLAIVTYAADGLVDGAGRPQDLEVSVRGDGTVSQAAGPAVSSFDTATYRLASFPQIADAARRAAGGGGPKVTLDQARLVSVVAFDGHYGYLEPAVLLTGRFEQGGQAYEMRLIVPALDPSQLR